MIKILSAAKIYEADRATCAEEKINSIELMERAAACCVDWIIDNCAKNNSFLIFCGPGKNGGDGLAIARMLINKGHKVKIIVSENENSISADAHINLQRLQSSFPHLIHKFSEIQQPIEVNSTIIDALFGIGLNRCPEFPYNEMIEWINQQNCPKISIDVPSGISVSLLGNQFCEVVKANFTLTFQLPKLSFLLPQSGELVGKLIVLDIGLSSKYIEKAECSYFLMEEKDIKNLIQPRKKFAHKGIFGHSLLIAGMRGKMGAAMLSAHACLKSGSGLVSALVPESEAFLMQSYLPEAMLLRDDPNISISAFSNFSAIGIGPGLGTDEKAQKKVKFLIQNSLTPIVFDADAINILADNKTWLSFMQPGNIFTPHFKEFERLTEKADSDNHRHKLAIDFAKKYSSYVILKGKYSCICCPDGKIYFNPSGNAGMAKGGSGDLLTGIVTALLAQNYSAKNACLIATYVHGLAGDLAAADYGEISLMARDILNHIPAAFKKVSFTAN